MIEKFWFGPTPSDETCAQVGDDNYSDLAFVETKAYRNQLYRLLKSSGYTNIPSSFRIKVASEAHDLGSYYEVIATFDSNDERVKECYDLAHFLDNNIPEEWDEDARRELGNF